VSCEQGLTVTIVLATVVDRANSDGAGPLRGATGAKHVARIGRHHVVIVAAKAAT